MPVRSCDRSRADGVTVIFLNGCTSAGKTSIARALQAELPTPFLRFGIDDAFAMLPRRLHNQPDGFFFDTDARGHIRLNHGPFGFATLKAHARAAAAIAAQGLDLILDEVVLEESLRQDWHAQLAGLPVFMVGVHCDLAELERREQQRGDRLIGQARGQIDLVHAQMRYDLEIDTTSTPPEASAAAIAAALAPWHKRAATNPKGH